MTDEMLRQAARNASRMFVEALEEDYDPRAAYPPSQAFRRKLRSLRRRAEHPYAHAALQRAAVFLLVLLLSGGVWMARDAYAGVPENWVRYTAQDGTINYRFLGEETGTILPVCRLTWIPEGYVLESEDDLREFGIYSAYYVDSETESGFIFDYQFMNNGASAGLYENEVSYERSAVNEFPADYYEPVKEDGARNLFWFDQENNLMFSINSRLDRETIFRIAEGVTLTEVP